ncbi:hypothetical protein SLS56_007639 [Neofusicoccum ribis]|uniref:DUF7580 domain-containing protein n=1 Tax=Neofusicoccum ribis TaxID=45134 RepID=A0ABR3SME7_9PEZI
MSGIEIAGLVLGAIPLLILAVEKYAEGVSAIKRFKHYEIPLKGMCRILKTERDMYRNTCELLPIELVSPEKIQSLLTTPGGKSWEEPELKLTIEHRLAESYNGYRETVEDMNILVQNFAEKLSLQISDYEGLLENMRKNNATLERLTQQSLRLEPHRTIRQRRKLPDFKAIQEQAQSIYSSLSSYFSCACNSLHAASIRMDPKPGASCIDIKNQVQSDGVRFGVLFSYIHEAPWSESISWGVQAVDITPLDDGKSSNDTHHKSSVTTASMGSKRVHFSIPKQKISPTLASAIVNSTRISNPCEAIGKLQACQSQACIGYLLDETTNRRHGLFAPEHSLVPQQPWYLTTLRNILDFKSKPSHQLNLEQRLRLSIYVATCIMRFHGTGWLGKGLKKDDLVFLDLASGAESEYLYIIKPSNSTARDFPAKLSILAAACRNKAIFSLGVLLTELCLAEPFEDLLDEELRRLSATGDSDDYWVLIKRIIDRVSHEAGKRYEHAVRRCLCCDLDRRSISFDNEDFYDVFYSKLVQQLEETYGFLFQFSE